jgi:cytochrome c biogenesis protein
MNSSAAGKIWRFSCSLKLAVVLASLATLVLMAGSLMIPAHPRVFGALDQMPLGEWFTRVGNHVPAKSWWLMVGSGLIVLLGINTLCCFIDWAVHIRVRWRKTGEYCIHLGFIMVLSAFLWGSLSGFRSGGNRVFVGETIPLEDMPGYALRLDSFEPVLNAAGRPIDMISTVTLLVNAKPVAQGAVKTNHPLHYRGLAVLPETFGKAPSGFNFFIPGHGIVPLPVGAKISLENGTVLEISDFHPHAARLMDGRVAPGGDRLDNPAVEMRLHRGDAAIWRGWYFLREGLPYSLVAEGVRLWPTEPLYSAFSVLTVNHDPGIRIALLGGLTMMAGVLLALVSFYYKRTRGDRPDIR